MIFLFPPVISMPPALTIVAISLKKLPLRADLIACISLRFSACEAHRLAGEQIARAPSGQGSNSCRTTGAVKRSWNFEALSLPVAGDRVPYQFVEGHTNFARRILKLSRSWLTFSFRDQVSGEILETHLDNGSFHMGVRHVTAGSTREDIYSSCSIV